MAGFSTRSDMVAEYQNGKLDDWIIGKTTGTANVGVDGTWATLWTSAGSPVAGANPATTPGTAYASDQSTQVAGSIWFPDRSTDVKCLYSLGLLTSTVDATIMLYDRLVGVSGILTTTTGNKTISSTALTRYSGTAADLNEVWLEVTTATNTTAPIVNLNSYTSADGTTAQSGGSVTFPQAATAVGTMIQMPLATNKRGVRSVEVGLNVGTASASTGTLNVLIIRPLARIHVGIGRYVELNFFDDVMEPVQILDNACLGLAAMTPSGAASGQVHGKLKLVYG